MLSEILRWIGDEALLQGMTKTEIHNMLRFITALPGVGAQHHQEIDKNAVSPQ